MNKFTEAMHTIQMLGREADLESVPHVDIRFHSHPDKARFIGRLQQLFAGQMYNGDTPPINQSIKNITIYGVRVNFMVGADL